MKSTYQADDREKTILLNNLRGAPALIILALVAYGRLTGRELQQKTGYSKDTITNGLQKLALLDIVYQVDQWRGWKLSNGIKQLSLDLTALLGSESEGIIEGDFQPTNEEMFLNFRNISPSSSSFSSSSLSLRKEEEEEERNGREVPKLSPPVDNPVDNSIEAQSESVASLLIRANIGRNSPKFREIIAQGHHPDYIRAHVLYFEWWQQQRQRQSVAKTIDGRTRYTVGTLITRILDNDPAPAIPQAQDNYTQYIPPELEGIIQR